MNALSMNITGTGPMLKVKKTSAKAARNARFQKGSALFTCRSCGHNTRATGQGDNEHVELCAVCYDLAGEENHLSDSDKLYGTTSEVLGLFKVLDSRVPGNKLFPEVRSYLRKELDDQPVEVVPAKTVKGKSITASPKVAVGAITVGDKGLGCTPSGTAFTGTIGGVPFTGPDRLGRFQVKGRYVPANVADAIRAAFASKPAKRSRKAA